MKTHDVVSKQSFLKTVLLVLVAVIASTSDGATIPSTTASETGAPHAVFPCLLCIFPSDPPVSVMVPGSIVPRPWPVDCSTLTNGLQLHVLSESPSAGDSVSLLAFRQGALPHAGYTVSRDISFDGTSISIDLFPEEPLHPDRFYAQAISNLHEEIVLEGLTPGHYNVDARWHSLWPDVGIETASASFVITPEPTSVLLVMTAVVVLVFGGDNLRRHQS